MAYKNNVTRKGDFFFIICWNVDKILHASMTFYFLFIHLPDFFFFYLFLIVANLYNQKWTAYWWVSVNTV